MQVRRGDEPRLDVLCGHPLDLLSRDVYSLIDLPLLGD